MPSTTRLQDVLLAILCVIAVGLSVLAYRAVNTGGDLTARTSKQPASAVASLGDVASSTGPAEETEEPDDGAATMTGDLPAGEVSVEDWLGAWSDTDADLLVVGDGYSALPEQWLQLWAGIEGQERPVTIRSWDPTSDSTFGEPVTLSEGDGTLLRVWNASRSETSISEAVDRLERFDEASSDPEAVLVSLGQSSGEEDVDASLTALVGGLDAVPVLVVVGPSSLYAEGVGPAIADWAQDRSERVAVVDLSDELGTEPTADEWAQAFAEALRTASSAR